jgi:DNA-binding CsgD family transcriptional regulator
VLVGRSRETAVLREALAEARRGRGRALLLRGSPGIGKTALLEDAVRGAEGFRVLRARALETESGLAFAGLSDLVRPVLECLPAVPGAQRAALRAALALGPPTVPDRFAAYAATLSLIGAVAVDSPLLIVVDDAHWLDAPSREALAFCARRIEDEPVAILAASREWPPERADLPGVDELAVGPLDAGAAEELLASTTSTAPLAPTVARQVLATAEGNPLVLVELPRAMTAEERAGRASLNRPPRAGAAIADAFRRRVEGVAPGPGRAALLLAAVSVDGALAPVAAALDDLGGGIQDLLDAEAAGFLVLEDEEVLLRHPVLRSVLLELSAPAERRDAHRALARAMDPERDLERRAWHLAEAAVGPDPEVAAALEGAAARAAERTGYAAAAALFERAAAFSEPASRAGGDLLAAAQMWFAAGDAPRAAAVADRLWERDPTGPLRAEAAHLRGFLTMLSSRADDAFALLVREARRIRPDDPAKAAQMLCDAGLTRAMAGRCRDALRCMQEAASYVPPDLAPQLAGSLAAGLTLAGRAREARPLFAVSERYLDAVEPVSPEGQTVVLSLTPLTWLGEFEVAERHLRRWLASARRAGCLAYVGFPQAFGAEIDFRRGRWRDARARALEAVRTLEETGQTSPLAFALVALAQVEAGLGREEDCRAHAERGLEIGDALGLGCMPVYRACALGLLEQGQGRPDAVVELLEPMVGYTDEQGLGEPATVMWQPDLIEAYARLGRAGEARRALAALAEQAHRTDGVWSRAAVSRCRGLLGDDFDRHFTEALRLHELTPMPFERARTELAYGSRLRRARRRAEGREQLRRALATFEELGAVPWTRRAREEVAASGAGLPRRGARPSEELSPRELQVARAAAEGLTNREAGARLFLSEKTVERHLGSVYRKLGLRSRTELARRFAERGPPGREAPLYEGEECVEGSG